MICPRCSGTMVIEEFVDQRSTQEGFAGARCLNCGHIDDALIRANRVRLPVKLRTRSARHAIAARLVT